MTICFHNFRVDPSKDMVYDDDTPYEPAEVDVESSDDSYISAEDDDSEESSGMPGGGKMERPSLDDLDAEEDSDDEELPDLE